VLPYANTILNRIFFVHILFIYELGERSWYSDWLQAGPPKDRGSSPGRVKNFLHPKSSIPALGSIQPPIPWVLGVKQLGHEADDSPPASVEVKKMWVYISTPPYAFMVKCLIH
jgi:hypothetical protein